MAIRNAHKSLRATKVLAVAIAIALVPSTMIAAGVSNGDVAASKAAAINHAKHGKYCSATALNQYAACLSEVGDDHFTANAVCTNVSDPQARSECFADARQESGEALQLCGEQRSARGNLCSVLGEDRYDPDINPADFDDDFTNLTNPNPWYPLDIGNQWVYESGDGKEIVAVEVLDKTKQIQGVTCIVVNDRSFDDGRLVENTDDWFGHRRDGTVDYCGEISQDFGYFDGDDPQESELVEIEGSWKAGRDGAKSGTLFPSMPVVGRIYRTEYAAGDAEDIVEVVSTNYGYGVDPDLDRFVPQALAELMCPNHDCVVMRDTTPLEPGEFEHKYYAVGIGQFLEVKPEEGEFAQLVDCNFDAKCEQLP
ncbi:hypothetical protein [Luteimonas salinilitoris]|uniref:Uncharacterized protein n=1 Tax=Luteimonas salinilitoris TaxID=3237697 RepID=A0ABV4HNS5_9GAMM